MAIHSNILLISVFVLQQPYCPRFLNKLTDFDGVFSIGFIIITKERTLFWQRFKGLRSEQKYWASGKEPDPIPPITAYAG